MTNEIIHLNDDGLIKSLKFNETNFWFSSGKHKTLDKMKSKVEKNNGKYLNNHGIVEFDKISKIKLNEKSDKVLVFYPNIKGKEEELTLEFNDSSEAHKIGEFIASKTSLTKSTSTENKSSTLFIGLIWPLGIAAATFFIAFVDIEYEVVGYSKSARRTRSGMAIIRFLRDNIGQTGIIIIGLLISILLLYSVWKRFKNPVNDIVFS